MKIKLFALKRESLLIDFTFFIKLFLFRINYTELRVDKLYTLFRIGLKQDILLKNNTIFGNIMENNWGIPEILLILTAYPPDTIRAIRKYTY